MILFFVILSLVIFYPSFLVRNNAVYRERVRMIDLIFNQDNWYEYIHIRDRVSYEYMLYHFWIWPVSKMWPQELQELEGNNELH